MNILIEKNLLQDAVNIASRAVPSKTTSNILKCLLLDASSEKIRIIGNDNELGIETTVGGEILEHGSIAVDANVFSNIVRKLPDGMVNIIVSGEKISIQCERVHFNILGMDGEEFAFLPEVSREYGIELSQFTLKELITKTIFSISSNQTNIMMTGELFEVMDNVLRVSSLDGHRISRRQVELKQAYDDCSAVIPGKTLSEISKIIGTDLEKTACVYFTERHVLFELDDTIVVSRLIEGKYFDVDSMLSNEFKLRVHVNRQEFLSCLERSMLLVREEDKKPVILNIHDHDMEIRIRSAMGSLNESIGVEKEGDDLTIGFNPRFMSDALRAIDEEEVDIYLQTQRYPAFIRDDNTYCYLVLPINFINID